MAAENPTSSAPEMQLGDILRNKKRYAEAVTPMTRRSAAPPRAGLPDRWTLFYDRGVALERSGQWERAEADLQHALELKPDQPLVLNYLGYSWIDRGENLEKGLKMIEKAVELRPEDGYIIDSLGWAHYRMGDYEARCSISKRRSSWCPRTRRSTTIWATPTGAPGGWSRRATSGGGRCSSGRRKTRSSRSRRSSNTASTSPPRRRGG